MPLVDAHMDKVTLLRAHPSVKDLLMSVSEDRGSPTLRFWDVSNGQLVASTPVEGGGVRFSSSRTECIRCCADMLFRSLTQLGTLVAAA